MFTSGGGNVARNHRQGANFYTRRWAELTFGRSFFGTASREVRRFAGNSAWLARSVTHALYANMKTASFIASSAAVAVLV